MFINLLSADPNLYFSLVIIITFSICFHEYCHARAALWQGDHTAAMQGHLTLNPLKQMGVLPIIMLLVVGISWGAVPVDPRNMRKKYSPALVAFAGPAANIALFLVFAFLAAISVKFGKNPVITISARDFLSSGAILNVVLFLFNMLPVPPLDGFNVFTYLFPAMNRINQEVRNGMLFLLLMIAFVSFGYFFYFGQFLTNLAIIAFLHIFNLF